MSQRNPRISHICISCLIIVVLFFSLGIVAAGELGHYMPGVASIRDFVMPSEPGFYYVQYNLYYSTDTYKDRNGNSVDSITIGPATLNVEANIDAIGIQPTLIWVSDWKILGASYGAFAGIPIASTSVQASLSTETRFGRSIDDNQWGLGDIYVKPIWLGWNTKHFGITLGYGLYAPTGKYDDGDVDNTGLGFWTHEVQSGVTWYPWEHQGTALMLNGTYEIHHEKEGADITPGDRFSLDWGISQFLPLNKEETLLVELGLVGYSQWQVDNDSGSDVIDVLKVKDEVHGIGGQVGLAYVPWNASLVFRYIGEYYAEARFEGDLYVLTLVKGF
jgi:hypothetical protein